MRTEIGLDAEISLGLRCTTSPPEKDWFGDAELSAVVAPDTGEPFALHAESIIAIIIITARCGESSGGQDDSGGNGTFQPVCGFRDLWRLLCLHTFIELTVS